MATKTFVFFVIKTLKTRNKTKIVIVTIIEDSTNHAALVQ
jgi:hypothetical protein